MITIGFKDTSIYIDIIRICSELLVWREKGKSKEEKKKKKEEKKRKRKRVEQHIMLGKHISQARSERRMHLDTSFFET